MDIYPTIKNEWKSIQNIFKKNMIMPFSRDPTPRQYSTTYYSNNRRGVARSGRIYPKPKKGFIKYLRVEIIFRRAYIKNQGWQFGQLDSLQRGIDLLSHLNYRRHLNRKESDKVGLDLSKKIHKPSPDNDNIGIWVLGQVFGELICPPEKLYDRVAVGSQINVYKEICKKRGIRARPERIFPSYPKAEAIRRDLENGFLRRSYEASA